MNITNPGTNRHLEKHEDTKTGFYTCLINLPMSFILKLLKIHFFKTQEQAMDILRIWYIIEQRAIPTTIKNSVYTLQVLKTVFISKFSTGQLTPPPYP